MVSRSWDINITRSLKYGYKYDKNREKYTNTIKIHYSRLELSFYDLQVFWNEAAVSVRSMVDGCTSQTKHLLKTYFPSF